LGGGEGIGERERISLRCRAPGKLAGCDDDLSSSFDNLEESFFLILELEFKQFCPPLKTSCPPAKNFNETPGRGGFEILTSCTIYSQFLCFCWWLPPLSAFYITKYHTILQFLPISPSSPSLPIGILLSGNLTLSTAVACIAGISGRRGKTLPLLLHPHSPGLHSRQNGGGRESESGDRRRGPHIFCLPTPSPFAHCRLLLSPPPSPPPHLCPVLCLLCSIQLNYAKVSSYVVNNASSVILILL